MKQAALKSKCSSCFSQFLGNNEAFWLGCLCHTPAKFVICVRFLKKADRCRKHEDMCQAVMMIYALSLSYRQTRNATTATFSSMSHKFGEANIHNTLSRQGLCFTVLMRTESAHACTLTHTATVFMPPDCVHRVHATRQCALCSCHQAVCTVFMPPGSVHCVHTKRQCAPCSHHQTVWLL